MSYSFSVRGATKAEVSEKVAAELEKVVAAQPIHRVDSPQALATVKAFLDVIPEDAAGKDFYISVSWSVGWNGTLGTDDCVVRSASVSCSASVVAKEKT